MTTEVVKFDVGGQVYKVSRSLLQMHPNSMLAKSASDQWQEDPEAEIFLEGDSARFRYVLDYLRHGSVTLPITESKEALTKELEYYGIDVSDNTIDDTAMHKAKSIHSLGIALVDLQQYVATSELDYRCSKLALDCIKHYLGGSVPYKKGQQREISNNFNNDEGAHKYIEALRTFVKGNDEKARKGANVHLNAVGLNLSAYKTAYGDYYDSRGKYVYGYYCSTAKLEEINVVQTEE